MGPGGVQQAAGRWELVAKHPVKIGFKMPTHIYLLCRMGLGEEHMQEVVQRLGLKVGPCTAREPLIRGYVTFIPYIS